MLLDATFPLIAMLSVYMGLVLVGYFREQMDRRRIRSAFARYLCPPSSSDWLNRQQLVLGGEPYHDGSVQRHARLSSIAETYNDNQAG